MKVKKYLITSGIGLIFVAILSFVLFKYTAPKSEIINLIPNKFTNIIDIKPNKFFIQTVSKFSYTKNNILALS
jgi:predicted small secreted protein